VHLDFCQKGVHLGEGKKKVGSPENTIEEKKISFPFWGEKVSM